MEPIQIISQDLFDKIRSRFENLEMGDKTGAVTIDPAEARFFDFDFVHEDTNLGRISISLNELGSLKIYYSQGITEGQEDVAKKIWYSFLKEMRQFAMRRLLRFDTRDIAKTKLDKNDFQYLANKGSDNNDQNLKENFYKVSDFKINFFESIKDYKKWMRSPKKDNRGMTRYSIERYENIFINEPSILEENQQFSQKKQEARIFSNKFKSLDKRELVKIKIGNQISLLSTTLVPSDENSRLEISGFVNPKKIVKIHTDYDNKIDSIEFEDGSRFPESAEFTTVGDTNITNTIFFPDKQSASKAFSIVWMMINRLEGNGWKIEHYLSENKKISKDEQMNQIKESRWSKTTRKTSRAVKGATEVIVRHAHAVDEEYPGSRSQRKNIKAIFIQNRDGERYKYPFIHPAGAFAMAQHVDHGGAPHDPAGKAIIRMSEQIAQLQEFQRSVQRTTLHDDAMGITEKAQHRLNHLKHQIENLSKRKHYESWMAEFQEQEEPLAELDAVTFEEYKSKFTQTQFKEELGKFFPLLHSIMQEKIDLEEYVNKDESEEENNQQDESINEFGQFVEWAEAVEQGKITDDQIEGLKAALADLESSGQKLELGPEGQTAFQFFSEFGLEDSDLEEKLKAAAELDSTSDPMSVLQLWAQDNYPELLVALGMSGTEPAQPETPPVEQPAAEVPPEQPPTEQPVAESGSKSMMKEIAETVKKFYNQSNESVGPFRSEEAVALEVEKTIEEKYGPNESKRAGLIARQFMEKLTRQWEMKHGKSAKVGDDGLSVDKLRELLDRVKSKVENVDKSKIPAYLRKEKGGDWKTSTQDLEKEKERNISGPEGLKAMKDKSGVKESEIVDILKLAGLQK